MRGPRLKWLCLQIHAILLDWRTEDGVVAWDQFGMTVKSIHLKKNEMRLEINVGDTN